MSPPMLVVELVLLGGNATLVRFGAAMLKITEGPVGPAAKTSHKVYRLR